MISKENTDKDRHLQDVFPLFGGLEPAVRRHHRVNVAGSREKEEKGAHERENFTRLPSKFYDSNSLFYMIGRTFCIQTRDEEIQVHVSHRRHGKGCQTAEKTNSSAQTVDPAEMFVKPKKEDDAGTSIGI